MSFPCSHCLSEKTSVKDSRSIEGGAIRRRRECPVCGSRFTTREVLLDEVEQIGQFIDLSTLPKPLADAMKMTADWWLQECRYVPPVEFYVEARRDVEEPV